MGLDIAFNRQQALSAGVKLVNEANGTEEEIEQARVDMNAQDYYDWLRRIDSVASIPGIPLRVIDYGDGDTMVVRANRWGDVYFSLIDWLLDNGIEWDEF